jgi:hypothetical protein
MRILFVFLSINLTVVVLYVFAAIRSRLNSDGFLFPFFLDDARITNSPMRDRVPVQARGRSR